MTNSLYMTFPANFAKVRTAVACDEASPEIGGIPVSGDARAHNAENLVERTKDAVMSNPTLSGEALGWLMDCGLDTWNVGPDAADRVHALYEGGIVEFYMVNRFLTPVVSK